MSVRFKFRSSVGFDSADLGGRPSISVRDLRAKIVAQKNLQICRDFDLVISDADTGQAFDDEEYQIPEGSSIIIKRVPAGQSLPPESAAAGLVGSSTVKQAGLITTLASSPSENVDMENFDDFGNDLYPTLEVSLPESDADVGNAKTTSNSKDNITRRCSEKSFSRCQNFESSDLSEAMSKEIREKCKEECDNEETKKQTELQHNKLDEAVGTFTPTMLNTELPTELRCSLCNTIFKEAVMIPCCQHSFCDKCIRSVLLERARCPKCSSLKCTVENLLPNLSLRQAIEHFLEAQKAIDGAADIIPKFAPDRESGIQAKEISCAVSIRQQYPTSPHSPSATGKGSNQVLTESAYESKRTAARVLKQMVGFQASGGSSKLSQNVLQKGEANWTNQKKKVPGVSPSDGSGVLMPLPPLRHKKGDRTCYRCGSPNHLFRDCPAASNPYPVLQTGDAAFPGDMSAYGQPYWHGAPINHIRPYGNIYGTAGVMPFDPTIVPVTPYGVPPYMPSLYTGMPIPYGFVRMGGVPPSMVAGTDRPLTHAEFMELQYGGMNHKLLNERPDREPKYDNISEDYHYHETRRSHEWKHHVDKDISRSCSNNDSQRIHKKHRHHSPSFMSDEEIDSVDGKHEKRTRLSVSGRRDQRMYYHEKSNSEVHDMSGSSGRLSRERERHHHSSCSKKLSERREHYDSDCSRRSHHQNRKEKSDNGKQVVKDYKKQNHTHHYHLESSFEPDSSTDRRRTHKEKESSQSSKHSMKKVRSMDNQLEDDRWEMVDGLDDNYKEEYYHRKHKRSR